jgi:hypothetical protein
LRSRRFGLGLRVEKHRGGNDLLVRMWSLGGQGASGETGLGELTHSIRGREGRMKAKFAAAAVLATAFSLLSIGPAQAASATVKCRSAKKEVIQAKKALKRKQRKFRRAKKSDNKVWIQETQKEFRKARARLKRQNKNKRRLCKAASGNAQNPPTSTPPTSTPANRPPVFPPDALKATSSKSSGGVVVDEFEVAPAVDPDGDSLTYTWDTYSEREDHLNLDPGNPLTAEWVYPYPNNCGPSISVTASDGKGGEDTESFFPEAHTNLVIC